MAQPVFSLAWHHNSNLRITAIQKVHFIPLGVSKHLIQTVSIPIPTMVQEFIIDRTM
jgi:hypothetical protein